MPLNIVATETLVLKYYYRRKGIGSFFLARHCLRRMFCKFMEHFPQQAGGESSINFPYEFLSDVFREFADGIPQGQFLHKFSTKTPSILR